MVVLFSYNRIDRLLYGGLGVRYYRTDIPESVYDGREQTQDFYNKRFLLFYKDLIDSDRIRKDKDKYVRDLVGLCKRLDKVNIDFKKNLLFFSSKDLYREVFLYGFSKRESLLSYQLIDSMEVLDIYLSTKGWNNNNVSVDDAIRSEQAVKRDVLCIYSNDFLTHWKNSEFIVPEMIESRYIKNTSKGDHRVTWVFYRGDRSTMSNNLFMCEALRLFTSKVESGSDGYQIIELDNILSRNSSFTGVRNNRVSNKYSNNDDVY